MSFGYGCPLAPLHRVWECAHDRLFIFSLLYLYPCLVFSFHDISLFIPFLHSLSPLLHVFFPSLLQFLFCLPYHFACVSYSFNYLWLFWTCFIFLFFSNLIFLSLAFRWAHLVSSFTQQWPNLSLCPSSTSPPNPCSHPEFLSPCVHMVSLLWLLQPWLCSSYLSKQGRRGSRQSREKPSMPLITA